MLKGFLQLTRRTELEAKENLLYAFNRNLWSAAANRIRGESGFNYVARIHHELKFPYYKCAEAACDRAQNSRRLETHKEYPRGARRSSPPRSRTEPSDVRWKAGVPALEEEQLEIAGEQEVGVREDHEEADRDREDGEKGDCEEEDQNGDSLRKRHNNYFGGGGGHRSPDAEKEKGKETSNVPGGVALTGHPRCSFHYQV
ncbi:hypothetical protein NDU88_004947 [Pleurodeles waltl]|uniref:Uncharacterized protein n=1 Tax=Pleurodeles waltl TaxID=8319 RepID=A0AAV7VK50_PLEWA|nr:hypothetical protein NDU88_004947 [Pleurodeles waltl]